MLIPRPNNLPKAAEQQSKTMEIYKKIALIMADTNAIGKNQKNQQQGFNFRGIDAVMNELHNTFAKHEVFILPEVVSFETMERPTKSGGVNTYTRATIRHRYVTTDGSSVETITVGEAMDSGDKGMNKAMSVALKYSLLQMLLIPTEEMKDPDAESHELAGSVDIALAEVREATTSAEVTAVWNRWACYKQNAKFKQAVVERGTTLKSQGR